MAAPRFGRLYASAVLRPFAEQLIQETGLRDGSVACDLLCDGGALSGALAAAVGRGSLVVSDVDSALVESVARDLAAARCSVRGVACDGQTLPMESASCDCVASLFTIGFGDGDALMLEALRVTRPGGTVMMVHWDADALPAHEDALAAALIEVTGTRTAFFDHIAPRLQLPRGASVSRLADLVRFDGIQHYWNAMVIERNFGDEQRPVSDDELASVRAICEARLAPYTAADGTMRIPVEAALVRMTAQAEPYDACA